MENSNDRNWWLIKAKPNKDEIAQSNLIRQDYETYRPLARRMKKRRGNMVEVEESLFPSYFFIHLDQTTDNWGPIRSTLGVNSIVKFGNKPAQVQTSVIEALKRQEEEFSSRTINLDRFKKGEKVIINDGPFLGYEGIFQNYDGEQRAFLLIDLLQKETRMAISTASLSTA
ncbi:MAG: Transcription/translation regulatory transformer protein RfaH [uncultured Thiotrichaceae bacterium]|uniref:Transcription/translation regulatory transformer protein RfaH n=1 Tax=uncultured Thiotrichaceae bacterium TaxID=298394 RepID=A0A6S6TYF3_9GAMM|nr:MAG: Transcription/translation regulatory transformer protein RfaH [uncultured Thiotrichaceae bacterium]